MFFHFLTEFLPFCHHTTVHWITCLKFNPVQAAYLKAHHLHCVAP